MKKSLIPVALASLFMTSTSPILACCGDIDLPAKETIMAQEDHEDHEDHDHEGHDHDHHDHDDHDHAFEFDPAHVVKKEGDHFIMAHGDHFHKIALSDLPEELVKETEEHLAGHPELAEAYDKQIQISEGYFEDEDVEDRDLSEWAGEWQSVYPYLEDGTLDPVMEQKAMDKDSEMNAEEYKEYYTKGYQTDVEQVTITEDSITFKRGDQEATATYEYSGYQILEYEKGNRGVRYLFTKTEGDEEAPASVQFSDHNIAPAHDLSHFHLYFSNEGHDQLIEELENWPTYYPADWDAGQILADLLNH